MKQKNSRCNFPCGKRIMTFSVAQIIQVECESSQSLVVHGGKVMCRCVCMRFNVNMYILFTWIHCHSNQIEKRTDDEKKWKFRLNLLKGVRFCKYKCATPASIKRSDFVLYFSFHRFALVPSLIFNDWQNRWFWIVSLPCRSHIKAKEQQKLFSN